VSRKDEEESYRCLRIVRKRPPPTLRRLVRLGSAWRSESHPALVMGGHPALGGTPLTYLSMPRWHQTGKYSWVEIQHESARRRKAVPVLKRSKSYPPLSKLRELCKKRQSKPPPLAIGQKPLRPLKVAGIGNGLSFGCHSVVSDTGVNADCATCRHLFSAQAPGYKAVGKAQATSRRYVRFPC